MFDNDKLLTVFTTINDKNIAYHVTNDSKNVDINRHNLANKYKFDLNNMHYMNQIHSNIVKNISSSSNMQECDALITNKINTPLMVMVADCIPILFYDDVKNVIAVAHAGRNGTLLNISSNTVNKMRYLYNCDVSNIKITLGPSIQQCCYEVSDELVEICEKNFGQDVVSNSNINLQAINKKQLLESGIKENNITISCVCTKCSIKNYFSYRKDQNCGRFAGILMMR